MMQKINLNQENIINENFKLDTLIKDNIHQEENERNKEENEKILNDSIHKINDVLEIQEKRHSSMDKISMSLHKDDRTNALLNLMKYYFKTNDELSTKLIEPYVLIYNHKIHNKNLSVKDDYLKEINIYVKHKITPEKLKKINIKKRLNKNHFKIEQLKNKIY